MNTTTSVAEGQEYKVYIYSDGHLAIDSDPTEVPPGSPQLQCMMQYLRSHPNRTSNPDEADLFIVPIYKYSSDWFRQHPDVQESQLSVLHERLSSSRWYLRHGGADHLFVCPSASCVELERLMINRYSVDVFSLWAGPTSGNKQTGRRCPFRLISFETAWLGNETNAAQEDCSANSGMAQSASKASDAIEMMLSTAFAKTRGKDLWKCGGGTSPQLQDTFEVPANDRTKIYDKGIVLDTAHKFVLCLIPKCASTAMKMMMKRVLGVPHWRSEDARCIHVKSINGLPHLDKNSTTQVHQVFDNPNWIKAALVRDPIVRTLSAYLQKIVELKHYRAIFWTASRPPTFAEYVDQLYYNPLIRARNRHFKEQSANCGFRYTKYNYIARVETIRPDVEELFRRLGLWEQYGASGWRGNGTGSFLASFVRAQNHDTPLKSSGSDSDVASYYTRDTLRKVHNMYKEDFDRFGYSYNKWLDLVQ